jgi:hypothetical protein
MAADRRLWWAGGAALAALALIIWGQSGAAPQGTTRAARAARPAPVTPAADAPVHVRLDLLAGQKRPPGGDPRNPFAFRARAVAAPPPSAAPAVPGPSGSATAPAPAGAVGAAPIALKFIGIVEAANGMKLAVLTDGRVVSHGQEGDIIEGRYRILKIGVESIELAHVDGRGQQTIRLTGQ